MSPTLSIQSPMRQHSNSAAANGFRYDLRDTLAATVVRELSFAEFRAAIEQSGKRFN